MKRKWYSFVLNKYFPLEVLAFALMVIFFLPFILVLMNASKVGYEITLTPLALPTDWGNLISNIVEILTRPKINYLRAFINSTLITAVSLVAIGTLSAMAAWVLVRTKTRYSFIIFMFFLTGMVIPFQVVMLPLVRLLETLKQLTGIPFKDTYHGVILAYIGFGAPLTIFMFHGFIKSIPMDIEEAAIIDGCSRPQVFFKIILPILKPIFVTMLVINGMWIWNDYLLPLLVIGERSTRSCCRITRIIQHFKGAYATPIRLMCISITGRGINNACAISNCGRIRIHIVTA
jgi:raffinose/stachyose/melibiose transport system permease protein